MYNTFAYLVYLALALVVVALVGRRIYHNGRFYLVEILGQEKIADATNRFLYAGYCLLNAGGAFHCLVRTQQFSSYLQAFEYVVEYQGQLLLLLGLLHAVNLSVLPFMKNMLRIKLRHTEELPGKTKTNV